MATSTSTLQTLLNKLRTPAPYNTTLALLSKAKLSLLHLNALTPRPDLPASTLALAREVYEIGALASIRAQDADGFLRYWNLLGGFYELSSEGVNGAGSGVNGGTAAAAVGERNKITGLYLLLLLTMGNYAGFHTELEGLEVRFVELGNAGNAKVEDDRYLGYPIKLERWLMEGSYDLVWKAMEGGQNLPCEEYGVFSSILTSQIRSEIASCSEKAYPSLPISSTKNLLFLESEGAVIQFAESRNWVIRDGRIYFPAVGAGAGAVNGVSGSPDAAKLLGEREEVSLVAIENTLGYARELETIV